MKEVNKLGLFRVLRKDYLKTRFIRGKFRSSCRGNDSYIIYFKKNAPV